jgi:glycosyltransferase involved in cell wall biosynthesis
MTANALRNIDLVRPPEPPPGGAAPLDIRHIVIDECHHPLRANGVYHVARMLALEQTKAGDVARIELLRARQEEMDGNVFDVRTDLLPLEGGKLLGRSVRLAPQIVTTMVAGAGLRTIFHIHSARQALLWFLSRELRRRGFAYAITVHGRYSHLYDQSGKTTRWLPLLYVKTAERAVLNVARFVQAVSEAEKKIIQRIAPHANVQVIPNAAFSSALSGAPPPPPRSARRPQFPHFGYCGRYEIEHKGLDLLIEGFAIYRQRGGKGLLTLIGTGPAREQIAAMAAHFEVGAFVEVGGPKFGEEKKTALKTWDFFVQPSRFDGIPIGALEAAFLGLPLIVTAGTGLREEVASFDAGVPIDEMTAEAVARAFEAAEAVDPDAWARKSRNAFTMAKSIGDWTKVAERLRSLYERAPA